MGMQAEAEFPPRHAGNERASRAAKDTVIRRKKSVLKKCARSLRGLPTAQAASSSLGFWHATTMLRRTTGPSRSKATTVRPKYDTSSRSRVDQLLLLRPSALTNAQVAPRDPQKNSLNSLYQLTTLVSSDNAPVATRSDASNRLKEIVSST